MSTVPTELPSEAYCDNWIGRRSLELLREAPEDRPWFLQVNFAGPHDPWDVTEEMYRWYRDPDVEFPAAVDPDPETDREDIQEVRRNYAAMVENIDRWVDRLLNVVEDRDELDDTLVVFASDHGEMLGDHGLWGKSYPYHPSVSVPLVVSGPDVEERGVVAEPATVLDLHATFLDQAGIEPGAVDSRSMSPYLAGDTQQAPRDVVFSGLGHWRLAFDGRHKLVRGWDPSRHLWDDDPWNEAETTRSLREREPLLFDLKNDPGETENIAENDVETRERLDVVLSEERPFRRRG